ncbi:MAG TPA: DUF1566 domain-containing protein, partial [Chryseosolibacter sp.]|nr:DUF1566 domain-containing protein [Chryseosolibacter sp.]
ATASDGTEQNGLYTSYLAKQMKIPQRIEDVFIQTRVEVRNTSNNQQSPQEWSQLTGRFYFSKEDENVASAESQSIVQPVSAAKKINLSRGTGATEFETKNVIAELLNTGYTVMDVLNSNVPLRYLYGLTYQGGIIVDINEKENQGILVSPFDLARGAKVTWDEAKELCESFSHEKYDDWNLPTKNALELIYTNLVKSKTGDFASGVYWSSSESGYSHAWGKSFGSGGTYDFDKTSEQYVRAVRVFKLK